MAQAPTDPPSPSLTGVTWQWVSFSDGMQAFDLTTPDYTVTFYADGRVGIKADCNIVLGSYTFEDSSMAILLGPSTLVACPPGSRGAEFTHYLSQVVLATFSENGSLILDLPFSSGSLVFSAQPQVTGTLSYRQRIALPPDALVRIQIIDVSIADRAATVVGEQVFNTDGAQVPFDFAVSYPASAIEENRRYSIAARITDGNGRLLFINDTIVPVITGGAPTSGIDLVLAMVSR
ncbi:MAG: YbaY family lipoprotein [Dehalococcoidia bacterium]